MGIHNNNNSRLIGRKKWVLCLNLARDIHTKEMWSLWWKYREERFSKGWYWRVGLQAELAERRRGGGLGGAGRAAELRALAVLLQQRQLPLRQPRLLVAARAVRLLIIPTLTTAIQKIVLVIGVFGPQNKLSLLVLAEKLFLFFLVCKFWFVFIFLCFAFFLSHI